MSRRSSPFLGYYAVDEEHITDAILLHADISSALVFRFAETTFQTIYLNFDGEVAALRLVVTEAEYSSLKHYRFVMIADSCDTMLDDRWYILAAIILRRLGVEADYNLDNRQICGQVKRSWKDTANH